MQEYQITAQQAGQRLDKYLHRCLPEAPMSFLYKMLRKKNITLNGRKAAGNEMAAAGDTVRLFLADETIQKMGGILQAAQNSDSKTAQNSITNSVQNSAVKSAQSSAAKSAQSSAVKSAQKSILKSARMEEGLLAYHRLSSQNPSLRILYEDDHIAAVYKPAGVLSQKARPEDLTLNEWFLGYLGANGKIREEDLRMFVPSVQNRLDRNTEGIVLLAKTLPGSHLLTRLQREHLLGKFYRMVVVGTMKGTGVIEGYLSKDSASNSVRLYQEKKPDTVYTRTEYRVVETFPLGWSEQGGAKENEKSREASKKTSKETSKETSGKTSKDKKSAKGSTAAAAALVEAQLITGKTHQLRAHFASLGHPILGDPKYGDPVMNQKAAGCGVRHQLLLCQRVEFPVLEGEFAYLSQKVIACEMPEIYRRLIFKSADQ